MITANPAGAPPLELLREPERAAALLDDERRELIAELRERPDSAAGLARRLGESRQRLNYHLRALEELGLVELQEERRRGNCTERILRVTARRFVLDPAILGEADVEPGAAGDRFSASWLVALAARAIRELAALQGRADRSGRRLATAGWSGEVRLARPGDLEAFVEDLTSAVAGVVARHSAGSGTGRPFRIVAGVYPGPEGEESTETGGEEG